MNPAVGSACLNSYGRVAGLTCTMIYSVDLAHYGVSRAKDWVSVNCGTTTDTMSQSKAFGTSKFTLWYLLFEMNFKFEISRVYCISKKKGQNLEK